MPSHDDDTDPHPSGSARFLGLSCSFNYGTPPRRLVGIVERAIYIGRTARGQIPDYSLTIRGNSGRQVEVSMVESGFSPNGTK